MNPTFWDVWQQMQGCRGIISDKPKSSYGYLVAVLKAYKTCLKSNGS